MADRGVGVRGEGRWMQRGNESGDLLAFTIHRDGDSEIFVMNADGTDVYSTGQKGRAPSWGG